MIPLSSLGLWRLECRCYMVAILGLLFSFALNSTAYPSGLISAVDSYNAFLSNYTLHTDRSSLEHLHSRSNFIKSLQFPARFCTTPPPLEAIECVCPNEVDYCVWEAISPVTISSPVNIYYPAFFSDLIIESTGSLIVSNIITVAGNLTLCDGSTVTFVDPVSMSSLVQNKLPILSVAGQIIGDTDANTIFSATLYDSIALLNSTFKRTFPLVAENGRQSSEQPVWPEYTKISTNAISSFCATYTIRFNSQQFTTNIAYDVNVVGCNQVTIIFVLSLAGCIIYVTVISVYVYITNRKEELDSYQATKTT